MRNCFFLTPALFSYYYINLTPSTRYVCVWPLHLKSSKPYNKIPVAHVHRLNYKQKYNLGKYFEIIFNGKHRRLSASMPHLPLDFAQYTRYFYILSKQFLIVHLDHF